MNIKVASIAPGTRIPFVDELKGIAIILVVLAHALDVLGIVHTFRGAAGVDIFLIASGFTLALSSTGIKVSVFLKRRLMRLLPLYWLSLLIFTLLGFLYSDGFTFTDIALHVFGLQAFAPYEYFGSINPAFWFMSLIVSMYFVFLAVRKRINDVLYMFSVGLFLTLIASFVYSYFGNTPALQMFVPRIMSFFVGMLAGGFFLSGGVEIKRTSLVLVAGILAYLVFIRGTFFANLQVALSIIAIWYVAREIMKYSYVTRWINPLFGALGLISYELFLFHQPLMQYLAPYALSNWFEISNPDRNTVVASVVVSIIVTLVISVIAHKATRLFRGQENTKTTPF